MKQIITTIILPISVIASSFIVQLKDQASLTTLLDPKDDYNRDNKLLSRPAVIKTISIGDKFQCFLTDLDDSKVDQLQKHPLVVDVLPNMEFKIFDDDEYRDDESVDVDEDTVEEEEEEDSGEYQDEELYEDVDDIVVQQTQFVDTFKSPTPTIPESPTVNINNDSITVQTDAPRHLARLSSHEGLYRQQAPFNYTYKETGKGITAYIIDTGIAIDHPEFEGRAVRGANFVPDEVGDLQGHGTHVAGIVGSKTYGVAKEVELVEVKVLDKRGSGDLSRILQGIEFATKDRSEKNLKAVANLSLGSYYSGILNDAVNAAFETGLVVVVAAGNSNMRASLYSPASAKDAITVGALDDRSDTIATFSNYGDKLDVFASGVDVVSLNLKDYTNPLRLSGTSMASPVVAGLSATFLESGVGTTEIRDKIVELSTKDVISLSVRQGLKYRDTPNRVAFNGYGEGENGEEAEGVTAASVSVSPFRQDRSLLVYLDELDDIEVSDWRILERSAEIRNHQL